MPLTIKKEHENPARPFSTLERGEIFLYKNTLYIKAHVIPSNDDPYDCGINLETGNEDLDFDSTEKVMPVRATLTYYIQGRD